MKTFPAAFTTELTKKTGITPIWILRLTVNGTTYDLSDSIYVFPVGMANGFNTTLPWIESWGELRESISGSIGEMLVSDFSVNVLVDQDNGNNIRHLALTYPLEQSPAELYLWLDGLTNATAPQKLFVGYVKDIDLPDETQVNLAIEDESTRFQKYIGTRISSEAYPLCDPNVVGKVIPIIFGTVEKLPALCVDSGWVTSITTDITPEQTNFIVSELPSYPITLKTITIDDEQMLIQSGAGTAIRENKALAGYGAGVSASSMYSTQYPPASAVDGIRVHTAAAVNAWHTAAIGTDAAPQWLNITFSAAMLIDEINIIFIQDDTSATAPQPTLAMTGTLYVMPKFDIYGYVPGTGYVLLQAVTGNTKVWYQHLLTAQKFTQILIAFRAGRPDGNGTTVVELEAWGTIDPGAPKNLQVLRGYNGTTKALHTKGSIVVEKKTTPLVYLVADHALDSINTVMARVRGVNVDITPDCTKYLTGTPEYPGQALITIPDFAMVSQRISLSISGDVTAKDPSHTHGAGNLASEVSTPQTATGTSDVLVQASWYWSDIQNQNRFPAQQTTGVRTVTFTPPGGTPFKGSMTAVVTANVPSTGGVWYMACGGKIVSPVYGGNVAGFTVPITLDATSVLGNSLMLVVGANPTGQRAVLNAFGSGTIHSASRNITYNASQVVSIVSAGTGVTLANTLGLTGNSVADIMIGDMILVDATRNITAPAAVIGNLLSTYCNDSTLTTVGTFPASYSLNGAITEYKKAIEWLDYLSFQCRSFFRKIGGISRLVVRDVNPAVTGTIPACCLTSEGIKQLAYKKAPISDVINKVKVLYSRDWTAVGKQSESYMQSIASTDVVSIAIYGEQEQPSMFMFDFVTSSTMANDLAGFYQDFYAARKWRISFSTYLDNAKYEFGDVAQLTFAADLVGVIVEAGIAPGSVSQIDRMNFVVETAIIPVGVPFGMSTLLGDQVHTKNREAVTYV